MILLAAILCIALLSMGMSYFSIRNERKKQKHVEEVSKDLSKNRVIYYAENSPEK